METTSRRCRWVCRRLPLLVGGDLAVAERRRVERHLIGCSACRVRRDASRQSLALLREVATLGPVRSRGDADGKTPSIWPALARQIRESKHQPDRFSVGGWSPSWKGLNLPPLVGYALAATLILGLGWFWSDSRTRSIPDPTRSAGPGVGTIASVVTPAPAPDVEFAPGPVVVEDSASLLAANALKFGYLDGFEVLSPQPFPRPSALPEATSSSAPLVLKPGSNPFDPPLSLRLDYDFDWGTLAGPYLDTQRAY